MWLLVTVVIRFPVLLLDHAGRWRQENGEETLNFHACTRSFWVCQEWIIPLKSTGQSVHIPVCPISAMKCQANMSQIGPGEAFGAWSLSLRPTKQGEEVFF